MKKPNLINNTNILLNLKKIFKKKKVLKATIGKIPIKIEKLGIMNLYYITPQKPHIFPPKWPKTYKNVHLRQKGNDIAAYSINNLITIIKTNDYEFC